MASIEQYGFRKISELASDLKTELESVVLIDTATTAFDNVEVYSGTGLSDIEGLLVDVPSDGCLIVVGNSQYDKDERRNIRKGEIQIFINGEFTNTSVADEFSASILLEAVIQHFMPQEGLRGKEKTILDTVFMPNSWNVVEAENYADMLIFNLDYVQSRIMPDTSTVIENITIEGEGFTYTFPLTLS